MPGTGNRFFVLLSCFVFVVIFTVENINARFWLNDFEVYYLAAKSFVNGTQVYGVPYGEDTGLYKYSPVLLLPFSVFTVLSYYPASVVHFVFIGIATVLAGLLTKTILYKLGLLRCHTREKWILPLTFILVLNHLFREMHLGNLNMIIVFLLCGGLYFVLEEKNWVAGLFIGACLLIKPYLIVLLLPLLVYRKYQTILSSGFFVLGCMLLMVVFAGWSRSIELHKQWFAAMTAHGTYLFSNHTLAGILRYYTGWDADAISQYVFPLLVLLIFSVYMILRNRRVVNPGELTLFFFSLLALVPNLFITDTEHFLFSFPLIVMALSYLFLQKNQLALVLFIMFAVLYGANSSDFFGHDLSDRFEVMGLLGIGNLGIVVLTNYLYLQSGILQRHEQKTNLAF